jgi:hypothetical protein
MADVRIHPQTAAGDPFASFAAGEGEGIHACNNGWVTIGQLVGDPETGEETVEYALYLCRRCAEGL